MEIMRSSELTSRQFVSVDPSKCIGCGICEYACALEKDGYLTNPIRSRIKVIHLNPLLNATTTCRFCENAPCVRACTRDALKQLENGILVVDEEKCNACSWCIQACPYGGITLHPDKGVVMVCDLCGGEPKCVEFCPEEALSLVSSEEEAQKIWISALERVKSEAERLANMIKMGMWAELVSDDEERELRLQEMLEALNRREIEKRSKI